MTDLTVSELTTIAKAITIYENFISEIMKLDSTIEVTLPETSTLRIIDSDGNEIGYIDYTEGGDLGFYSQ